MYIFHSFSSKRILTMSPLLCCCSLYSTVEATLKTNKAYRWQHIFVRDARHDLALPVLGSRLLEKGLKHSYLPRVVVFTNVRQGIYMYESCFVHLQYTQGCTNQHSPKKAHENCFYSSNICFWLAYMNIKFDQRQDFYALRVQKKYLSYF